MTTSCLEIACRSLSGTRASAAMLNYPPTLHVTHRGYRNVATSSLLGYTAASARIGGLTLRSGIICSISTAKRLHVSPQNIWLTPANNFSADVVIISNIEWHIEQ